jgi:hypothetical protein
VQGAHCEPGPGETPSPSEPLEPSPGLAERARLPDLALAPREGSTPSSRGSPYAWGGRGSWGVSMRLREALISPRVRAISSRHSAIISASVCPGRLRTMPHPGRQGSSSPRRLLRTCSVSACQRTAHSTDTEGRVVNGWRVPCYRTSRPCGASWTDSRTSHLDDQAQGDDLDEKPVPPGWGKTPKTGKVGREPGGRPPKTGWNRIVDLKLRNDQAPNTGKIWSSRIFDQERRADILTLAFENLENRLGWLDFQLLQLDVVCQVEGDLG